MNIYDNLYCKIFIDTDKDRKFVLSSIAKIVSSTFLF